MFVWAACILWLVLLFIPFLPGIRELRRPRDAAPLFVDMEYTKDPRYFGKSFRSVIRKYLDADLHQQELRKVPLTRQEETLVSPSRTVPAGGKFNQILCISGDLMSGEGAHFRKEVYASGKAILGSDTVMQAVAVDGALMLGSHATVMRWADAGEAAEVGDGCTIGVSVSSRGELRIAPGCRFRRLYGSPIVTGSTDESSQTGAHGLNSGAVGKRTMVRDVSSVPGGTTIQSDLIVKNNLRIANHCTIGGNVKTYKGLVIGEHVTVTGNIFSEDDITIGEHAVIEGNVFCQGRVIIRGDAQIGQFGKVKSVIGKRSVLIGRNVRVYGYVLTEGEGMVL